MEQKDYYNNIKNRMDEEKIKYNDKELKKVVEYALEKHNRKKILEDTTMNYVMEIASEVATLRLDDKSIYASLLYPIVDYEEYNSKEVKEIAGEDTLDLITKFKQLEEKYTPDDRMNVNLSAETIRNMFVAIAEDIRVVIIKIAERLSFMRRIYSTDSKIKEVAAKECLEIYAPLAHRFGMSKVKSELEDISFRILLPDEYHKIKEQIDEKKEEREAYIDARINEIKKVLDDQGIKATVYGRPKHFYSIYKKMKAKDCDAEDLFDLIAIRVIVESVKDCYNVLGIVHDMYKPMPGRFKDYIAVPKTNMYQSLHTTVFGEGGRPFEIQIRTWNMHSVAERGIAAHFSYKEKSAKISDSDMSMISLREKLDEIQENIKDSENGLQKIKEEELLGVEVFVFTPKGELKSLPRGSTPIDFAYAIHQKVAESMVGAKINGRMVPLNTKLANKDVVEIVTSKNSKGPNRDWLKYVKTTSAKNKITSFLKKEGREINIQSGKESFEKMIKKSKYPKEELLKDEYVMPALKKFSFKTIDDCYENIGFGSISPVKIVNKIVEIYEDSLKEDEEIDQTQIVSNKKTKNSGNNLIEVEGIDNCLVKIAKCCSPIPGDDIIGYITFANGVSVHRRDCTNLKALDVDTRTINVKWRNVKAPFTTKIHIKANDTGIYDQYIRILKDNKVEIVDKVQNEIKVDRQMDTIFPLRFKDIETMDKVIKEIKNINSVFYVKRKK